VPIACEPLTGDLPMTNDRELWACAAHVLARHGEEVNAFVFERVATLTRAGDEAGVKTWLSIATRIDALSKRPESATH
jgi:hypothetical protein